MCNPRRPDNIDKTDNFEQQKKNHKATTLDIDNNLCSYERCCYFSFIQIHTLR